jgi:deoxyribonuclease V
VLRSDWRLTPARARLVQERLRRRVRQVRLRRSKLEYVAGCDITLQGDRLLAVVLVFSFPGLERIETRSATMSARMPYIPGLLGFRELPALLKAFAGLRHVPHAVLCDGHGRAHPRRFGLASHLGVLLDLPAIGCAKSRLIGTYAEPGPTRGAHTPLRDQGEVIGAVLRTRDRIRPLYVSVGHRVTLPDAVWVVLQCGRGYRIPEPLRQADITVRRLARNPA